MKKLINLLLILCISICSYGQIGSIEKPPEYTSGECDELVAVGGTFDLNEDCNVLSWSIEFCGSENICHGYLGGNYTMLIEIAPLVPMLIPIYVPPFSSKCKVVSGISLLDEEYVPIVYLLGIKNELGEDITVEGLNIDDTCP